jgi:predicted RNase H-like nuclease (RuvC/YqgF family)
MTGEVHAISAAIGRLEAQMEMLSSSFSKSLEETRDEHRKVHDIVVATSESVRNLTKDLSKITPDIEEYRRNREQAKGAAKLAKALYVGFGVLTSVGAYKAFEVFKDIMTAKAHP